MEKKNFKKFLFITFGIILIVCLVFLFNRSKNIQVFDGDNSSELIIVKEITQASPPAGAYCRALGYKRETVEGIGGEYGVCIFPDGTSCAIWPFYRGKCGQEWSYCARKGYNLKNLTDDEGWSWDGSICINKTTKEEVGNVYILVNKQWAEQNK
jgi:putative hemolysin